MNLSLGGCVSFFIITWSLIFKGIPVPMFQNLALCVKFVVANNIYILEVLSFGYGKRLEVLDWVLYFGER